MSITAGLSFLVAYNLTLTTASMTCCLPLAVNTILNRMGPKKYDTIPTWFAEAVEREREKQNGQITVLLTQWASVCSRTDTQKNTRRSLLFYLLVCSWAQTRLCGYTVKTIFLKPVMWKKKTKQNNKTRPSWCNKRHFKV